MKSLWYTYFEIYLAFNSLGLIKVFHLKKKDKKQAAEYALQRVEATCIIMQERHTERYASISINN